jgi:hypothetical protein
MEVLPTNLVRLRGTARRIGDGNGPLAGNCELAVRHKKQRHVVDGKFEVVDDAGKVTVVDIAGADVLAPQEKRGPYKDFADEPGVSAISIRPDPAIEVTLRTAWVLDGKPIEVLAIREDAGLRALAAGPNDVLDSWAETQKKEAARRAVTPQKTRLPWDVIVPLALVIAIIVLAELSLVFGGAHFAFMAPSIAITTAAAAVGLLWDQIKLPKFDEREKKRTGLFATLAIVLGIAINLTPDSPLGAAIQGGLVLAVGVFGTIREARVVRLAKRLAAAPTQPEEGRPGVFVGKVGDDSPEQFFSQLIAVGAIHTIRKHAKGVAKKVETERKGFDTPFQLQLQTGNIEIDPKQATWSSELRNKRETWSVFLPLDASIVVAGTPVREGKKLAIRGTEKDSLVFYGAPGDQDPQALLRRKLALHKLTYGSLLMVVSLAAAIAVHGYLHAG